MMVDLDSAVLTQKDVAAWTEADEKVLNNYVHHGHVAPAQVTGNRRMFTPRQAIQIDLIVRLGQIFKIPPSVATILAERFSQHPCVDADAMNIGDSGWVRRASERVSATISRQGDDVQLAEGNEPDAIMVVVPVQLFARGVLERIRRSREEGHGQV